ncbi:MAG TPA: pantoate--beta-alanine ligase, partial [Longimicrobiaceae bacterium]|nr:pantoate--beta-alanine ligase [Longimicrobiaceae bacterium]
FALSRDLADHVLVPDRGEIYPNDHRYRVSEYWLALKLEGVHRPGHFEGVLTVVLKLLNLVRPTRAYFGEKDWQQLELVKGMAESFFLPVEIIGCPTVREPDGLACSSRNTRLTASGRAQASHFHRILRCAPDAATAARELRYAGFEVDYVEDRGFVRLGAVWLEGVRLIDNVLF